MNRETALALSEHLRQWMANLKVDTQPDFLPAEVCCDMTGIVPFRNCMADQILDFLNKRSQEE